MRRTGLLGAVAVIIGALALAGCSDPASTAGSAAESLPPQMAAPASTQSAASSGTESEADSDAGEAPIDPSSPVNPQPATSGTIPLIGSTTRDLRGFTSRAPAVKRPSVELPSPPDRMTGGPSAGVQTVKATVAPATTPSAFDGMSLSANGAGWPPDTSGDVGPSHFVQAVNTSVAMYNKDGTVAAGPFTFNSFFSSAGTNTPCDSKNQGDPVVVYDWKSQRWIITDFAWSNLTSGPWYECIAVSKTSSPVTGGWNFYGFQASTLAMNDYPKLGVWGNGIWMTANMFKKARTYSNAQVWVLNRDDMAAGRAIKYVSWNMGSSNFSLLPGNIENPADDTGDGAQYALSSYGSSSSLSMWRFTVNWTATPPTGTVSSKIPIGVTTYTKASGRVPQKGVSETLDALGDRLMYPLQYQNGSLWVTASVAPSYGRFGVRWWQLGNLAGTPTVQQQSTWAPDTALERWMPSIAVNRAGETAVIYSASSSSAYPSIRMSGRTSAAASETLDITETTLHAGSGSQSGGYNRWGDYAITAVDPTDQCTFWYSSEYYSTTGSNWRTKFGSFKLTSCP